MAIPFIKTSFAAGEIAPALYGHADLSKYQIGATTMRNYFAGIRGGAYSRAGTLFCGYSKQTGRTLPPRLLAFQFSVTQGLILEFGNMYMRVLSNGAFVTESGTVATITGATKANPCVITAANSFANGDWVYISGVSGMTQLNGQTYVVAGVSGGAFSLHDVFGNNINSTAFGTYVSGGTAARIYTLATPYADTDLGWLKITQSADVMSLCCWNQVTGTSYSPYDLARLADDDWTLDATNFEPTVAPPPWCTAVSSGSGNSTTGYATYSYVVTAVNPKDGTESIASPIGTIFGGVPIALSAGTNTISWGAVSGVNEYNIYAATPAYNAIEVPNAPPLGSLFGYVGTAYGTQWIDSNTVPDFEQVPPTHLNPFAPGQIEDVVITSGGSGITAVTWSITTATGSGFTGYPVIVGNALSDFVITDTGKNYLPGDTIAFNGAGFAGGAITFVTNPADGDTVTLNGVIWTFKSALSAGDQTQIQGTLAETLTQLTHDLSVSGDPALTVAAYTANATVLSINYLTAGTAGDAYTLDASVGTPSGATLTGGSGIGGTAPSGTLTIGPTIGIFPSVVSYFQERRVYAASPNQPDTYWMSQPGSFSNLDARLPTIDTDAITGTPWSVQVNGIQALIPMPGGLVAFTGNQAWQVTGAGGSAINPQPITPASQQAQPQAFNGSSPNVPPIQVDYDINYLNNLSVVYDLNYNYFINIYTGTDTTIFSSQLFTGFTIREWTWCREPYKLFWAARSDGIMLSWTYLKTQEVSAWCRHDTNGLFWSVSSIAENVGLNPSAGNVFTNALYMATQRYVNSQQPFMIERMDDRIWPSAEDSWCVDAALTLPLAMPSATLTASSAYGPGSLSGVTNVVGGEGYSDDTTVSVVDDNGKGVGTGAVPVYTIVGGAVNITGFSPQGQNYTYPEIVIFDPAGTGTGASAAAILNTTITLSASAGVFTSGSVGSVVRMGGGIMTITAYTDSEHVMASVSTPIIGTIPNSGGIPYPATAGTWSVAAPVTTIGGLTHLVGMTVTGVADGNEITPRAVSGTGSVTLDAPATAVTVGLAFLPQLQSTYLEVGSPTVQGQRKKIAAVTLRMEASKGFSVAANQLDGSTLSPPQIAPIWSGLEPVPNYKPGSVRAAYNSNVVPLYTGDRRIVLQGGFDIPGQVAVQQNSPFPANVLAFIPEVLPGDLPQSGSGGDQHRAQRQAAAHPG